MNIILTGGTGFLGSHLLKKMVSDNFNIILLKRSFSDTRRINDCLDKVICYNIDQCDINDIFKNNKIDAIIHCATDYGRKQVNPLQIIDANLILPLKLLQIGQENHVKCFINTDTILDKRVSHYSLSKKQFIDWLKTYQDKMACVNIALEHFYGPGDDKTKFVTHVFHDLLRGVYIIDFTKGEQKRDFVYIDDVVEAFLRIIDDLEKRHNGFYHYEVGTNNLISIKELVEMMKQITDNNKTTLNFGALSYRDNEVMMSCPDTEAIRSLGWLPKYDIHTGLIKMYEIEKKLYL